MAELLVWPALLAYGEAAVAYAGGLRGPGRYGRLGIGGVRIGWLAQTALLVAQAATTDGFPWGTWAGALNLLSWLVVTAYLAWGSNPRYRLLGLGHDRRAEEPDGAEQPDPPPCRGPGALLLRETRHVTEQHSTQSLLALSAPRHARLPGMGHRVRR